MPALIAIEVSAPEPERAQWVASMLDACNQSLAQGSCVYTLEKNPSVSHTALVIWNAPLEATVTFHDTTAGRTLRRTLHFHRDDEEREKWRMLGFTTALLAGEHSPVVPPEPPSDDPEPQHFYGALTARVLGASGLTQRPPKVGAQLRADGRVWQAAWLLGVSAEYSSATWTAPGVEGQASWSELGVGATAMWYPAKQLQLFTRLDVLAQRLLMTGSKKKEQEAAELWQPGLRLALDVQWPLSRTWYAVVGAFGTVVVAPVALRVDDKVSERAAPAALGLNAGVQYRF